MVLPLVLVFRDTHPPNVVASTQIRSLGLRFLRVQYLIYVVRNSNNTNVVDDFICYLSHLINAR